MTLTDDNYYLNCNLFYTYIHSYINLLNYSRFLFLLFCETKKSIRLTINQNKCVYIYIYIYIYLNEYLCECDKDFFLSYDDYLPSFSFLPFFNPLYYSIVSQRPSSIQKGKHAILKVMIYQLKKRNEEMKSDTASTHVVSTSSLNDNSNIYINISFGIFLLKLYTLTISIVIQDCFFFTLVLINKNLTVCLEY